MPDELTRREQFAAAASTGLLAQVAGQPGNFWEPANLALEAFKVADEMIRVSDESAATGEIMRPLEAAGLRFEIAVDRASLEDGVDATRAETFGFAIPAQARALLPSGWVRISSGVGNKLGWPRLLTNDEQITLRIVLSGAMAQAKYL